LKRQQRSSTEEIAHQLGITPSSVRARRARGTSLDAPRQLRLTPGQRARIRRAKGSAAEVAAKFGCSATTVKRLRAASDGNPQS
jgi:DNA-directed RNA polymerase specialized sigma24 family protein